MNIFTMEIDPKEIKLLEMNARYMKHEEFRRLVDNVRKDGQLSSAPFLCRDDDGRWLCLSGNHRTQAAVEVGLKKIICLATEDPLTKDQRIAIQLSHNSIAGQDDPATLKLLYEEILDVEAKKYSGLDDKTLDLLDKFASVSISESNLKFQTLQMVFLPDELEEAEQVIDKVREEAKHADAVWLARHSSYDDWLDTQEATMASYGIKNAATAIDLVLKLAARNITQPREGYEDASADKKWVPIETVIGRLKIPDGAAKVISKALNRMQGRGEINSNELWAGLEQLAAAYLSGD
ncbi:MAG: ParB/RepB/Spo0J family partition protein [Anaerovibrio sp.]|uniref:ParB/RepB/Spo0J family partition protein n=1 Tax=Anaerovibrio sp. TaxID=1872532 RepID=UPI002E788E2F|nr:ParB/RepB/Spo0J family partition protein [Anaerovibrio sp.]MEE1306757.1 ParB/RepB/Spo0J family partition protein [Anaerovibrio sp.]